jgi:hypothetical protein
MKRQASFFKLTNVLENDRLIGDCLGSLKSKRAEMLYRELLKMSSDNNAILLPLTYKYLRERLGYEHISIRVALWELEKLSMITKTPGRMSGSFYIELNPEYWVDNKKNYMKEKFEDTRGLLGEINDAIGFEHEGQCQELMSNILNSLEELEFILEDVIC